LLSSKETPSHLATAGIVTAVAQAVIDDSMKGWKMMNRSLKFSAL